MLEGKKQARMKAGIGTERNLFFWRAASRRGHDDTLEARC